MNVDEAFSKILGRPPSDGERAHLYHLRDALGLHENDAFWFILLTLERYDSLYRDYPRQIRQQVGATIEDARKAFAAAAAAESAKAQRTLSEKVAETSVAIAKRLADRPVAIDRVTLLLGAVVAFGAVCMATGAKLADGRAVWWIARPGDGRAREALATVLSAPAGWMVFALLLPVAVMGGRYGWNLACDAEGRTGEAALGWALMLLSVVTSAALAVFVLWTIE